MQNNIILYLFYFMGCIGLKGYNTYIYRKPGDGKYI